MSHHETTLVVLTGATRGIGLATARALDERRSRLVVVARDRARATSVLAGIPSVVDVVDGDLGSLDSVRGAASRIRERHGRIDVLINNAGVLKRRREVTVDGFEMNWAVHHLGPLLLSLELLACLRAARGRIVNVSSEGHRGALMSARPVTIDFDDLQSERDYSVFMAYSRSKLAQLMTGYELARRVDDVTVNALHPGMIRTDIARELPGWTVRLLGLFALGAPEDAARALVRLALASDLEGVTGRYFDGMRESCSSGASHDRAVAERLWRTSCEMIGLPEPELGRELAPQGSSRTPVRGA